MLTRITPDLPQPSNSTLPADRLGAIEARLGALETDGTNLLAAITQYFETLNKEGSLTIADASITATKGIAFPATAFSSTDPNTLDDYEEGTFVPTILGSTTPGVQGYATAAGVYTKVGRIVLVEATIILSSKDGATAGIMRIGGFPFAASASGNGGGLAVSFYRNWNLAAGYSQLSLLMIAGAAQANVIQSGDNVSESTFAPTDFVLTTAISFGGCYIV